MGSYNDRLEQKTSKSLRKRLRKAVASYRQWLQSYHALLDGLDSSIAPAIVAHINAFGLALNSARPLAGHLVTDQINHSLEHTHSLLIQQLETLQHDITQHTALLNKENVSSSLELEKEKHRLQLEQKKISITLAELASLEIQLNEQMAMLLNCFAPGDIDSHIESCRQQLLSSWTSHGMSRAIDSFFAGLVQNLADIQQQTQQCNEQLTQIYEKYGQDGIEELVKDRMLNLAPHSQALNLLQRQANKFKGHYRTVLTQKNHVIEIFSNTLLKEAQFLFQQIAKDIMAWPANALAPLTHYCGNKNRQLDKYITQAKHLRQRQEEQQQDLLSLQHQHKAIQLAANALRAIIQLAHFSPKPSELTLSDDISARALTIDVESHLAS